VISSMREYFRSLKFILLLIIAAFVATSVVYFGSGSLSGGGSSPNAVATVNGEEIPFERYRRTYAHYTELYRQTYGAQFTPELAERLGLADQVINDLVLDALIVQRAGREGIRVTDEELRAHILRIRAFQEDGRFSGDRYRQVLQRARLNEASFEADQRRELQRRKMEALVKEGIKVTEDEVRQAYQARHARVRAAWAQVEIPPLMAQVSVSDADAEVHLKSHPAQFTRPERRRVQYVVVSARLFAQPVSDGEAEKYYTENAAEFERPRRARVAHVLVRVPPTGGSEAENRSKAKVEEVIKRVKAGEAFDRLAREISEDPASAPQGGDLGFVSPGEMVPQFEEAVFALKKGEVSPAPVRTPFGYHAIRVLEVQEGGRQPFREVAGQIKDKLLEERSDRAARARAEEARAPLQAAKDFPAEARKLGLEPREAALARGDGLEGIGRDPQLEDAVFGLAMGGVSTPIKTAGGYVVAKGVEQFPPGVPPLAEIRPQVVEAAKRERAEAMAMERAKALAEAVSKGGELAALARRDGLPGGETPAFSRAEPPKERGTTLPTEVLVAALQTAAGQVAEPVRTPAGVYLVKTLERQPPDLQGFDKEREELQRQLLEQKRSQAWENWARGLRAQAKVEMVGQSQTAGR